MNITLNEDRTVAWEEMLNVQSGETLESKLQTYLDNIADTHITAKLDAEFQAKSDSEKQTLLA